MRIITALLLKAKLTILKPKKPFCRRFKGLSKRNLIDSITVLPDPVLEPKVFGIVDVSVSSIYAAPRYSSELVDQVLLGHTVTVLKESHGWFYVKSTPVAPLDEGYLGWIDSDNIVRIDSLTFAAYTATRKIIVTSIFAMVHSSPNGGTTISDIVMADFLKPIAITAPSLKVELPDGRIGYVSKSDAQYYDDYLSTHKATPEGIEKYAKEFLGFPYLWGGTSTKSLDCSGFVKTVFRMNGIVLPRDASQQAEVGDSIAPGADFINLKKGNLLFFGEKARPTKAERIVHVGIYLGSGYFIHSSSLVRINSLIKNDSLFDQYELDRFVKAKRILSPQSGTISTK